MQIDVLPLISFVVITTFTPGPNNISSASMGVLYGYRNTVPFLTGIAAGFFLVMLCCAFLASAILSVMPALQPWLRLGGAAYILWLAAGILRSSPSIDPQKAMPRAFARGLALQLVNLKVAVYGLTLFSTFLASLAGQTIPLLLCSAAFAFTAFLSTTTWALGGAAIRERLSSARFRRNVNLTLALMLVYTAMDLSGIGGVM